MKPRIWTLACLAVTLASIAARAQSADWQARGKLWWSHVQFLAGDNLKAGEPAHRVSRKPQTIWRNNSVPLV